ncbi:MAG: radical SAM protein, partial [Candidatus Neomarinimicrobiota bacterium]
MQPDPTLDKGTRSTTGGVYLHIPFCRSKCFYCDFYSLAGRDDAIDRFVRCLEKELRQAGEYPPTWSVDTVFIGGGTPNLLPPKAVERLLRALDDALGLGA